MVRGINAELREAIAQRARLLCEYCLIAEADTFYGCEVDHIISLKHGGSSESENLAYACALCNRAKGSDIGSISTDGDFTRFFNPRTDRWSEHFRLEEATIHPLTPIGEVTTRILGFNHSARLHDVTKWFVLENTQARPLASACSCKSVIDEPQKGT